MQTIRQREILSRAATNDPRIERATYHRDPIWLEAPEPDHLGDRVVGWVLWIAFVALVMLLVGERYLPAGVL